MDAKARFRLSLGAKLHSTWHNPNWNFNPNGKQMSPPQSPQAQRHGSPPRELNYLCARPQFDRSTKRIVSPAFVATTTEPRVATVSSVKGPSPTTYAPKLLSNGKEWDFADLNGAERMEMSAFTSRSDARATPQQWARGNLIAPNHSLHDDRPWLGPGSHDPAYHSIDATFGLESALRRKATRIRSRRAIRTVRPAASQRALELFASASGCRRLHHSSTAPLLRPVTAPF